ncbi:hypothetical protein PHMEG_0007165 [Phytophthora megakarya]|uniref:Uncharacterized protein n=1 Tax=Phytophthora megakarya TaxID=4795 RepID=A0A225WPB6_9STRA|nr:hypothetical protein PHMEG_0007165 [Phytophthora megakarya]
MGAITEAHTEDEYDMSLRLGKTRQRLEEGLSTPTGNVVDEQICLHLSEISHAAQTLKMFGVGASNNPYQKLVKKNMPGEKKLNVSAPCIASTSLPTATILIPLSYQVGATTFRAMWTTTGKAIEYVGTAPLGNFLMRLLAAAAVPDRSRFQVRNTHLNSCFDSSTTPVL